MAAPLKGPGLMLVGYRRGLPATCVRLASNWRNKKNGPAPWMAQQLPSGRTSYAIQLTQMQNRVLWGKRMDKVNSHWRQTLKDYNTHKRQKEVAESESAGSATGQEQSPPPKLLMVRQVKTTGGSPYWEKHIVKELKLEIDQPVIVKNKENVSRLLKKIKHLIEIHPVTFPYGLPETEDDYAHCVLRDNGEFIVTRKLRALGEEDTTVNLTTTDQPESVWNIKQQLIDNTLEARKNLYMVHQEYFPTRYMYKKNQDGKEYRYKGDHSIGSDKTWY